MGRYYVKGQNVLANCGTKKEPNWLPGVVVSVEVAQRPYQVKFDTEVDGRTEWYFPANMVVDDNRRNRKRKEVAI